MLPSEFVLYWKRAFRVVLPVLLAMDMVHSMYYVAGLYQKRLQEWEQEDHVERCIELLPVMQRVLEHCHTREPLPWPPTVTAAFNSAVQGTPRLASLDILQPSKSNQGNATSSASAEINAGLPVPIHIAHLGLETGHADLDADADNTANSYSQLGSLPVTVMQSTDPGNTPVTSVWTRIQSLQFSKWRLPALPSYLNFQQQASDSPQAKLTHLQTSLVCNDNHQTSVTSSCSLLDQTQQSMYRFADQISHQAKLQGLPWPMMCCTRRSALRWQVEWHGLHWPAKQDSLELQLDRYY